jgi:hypothetical protein
MLGGAVVVVAAVIYFAPEIDDLVMQVRQPGSGAATASPARPAAAAPVESEAAASLKRRAAGRPVALHGSADWRVDLLELCRRRHAELLWRRIQGDLAAESSRRRPQRRGRSKDTTCFHNYAKRAPDKYVVEELTLSRLRYGDARSLEIHCRRP